MLLVACLLLCFTEARSGAQGIPSGPVTTAAGRLTLGAQVSASAAPDTDDSQSTYFNYSDYQYNLMRLVRLDGSAVFRLGSRLSFLGDLRAQGTYGGEGSWTLQPYALFARIRPWPAHAFDIQAGLIPPVFGTFGRRTYANDNPLIGYPLAYQYLTSLRADAIPASADDLLRMRGRGWLVHYPVGAQTSNPGVPVMSGLKYDTGIEVHAGTEPIEVAAAVTTGTLSRPLARDDNGGKQVSGRIAVHPAFGLVVGFSAARGTFLARSVTDPLGAAASATSNDQRAIGFDVEYSRDYWEVRAESILSRWRLPALRAPFIDGPLGALAFDVEGRYKIRPGLYAAARVGHLTFSDITGTAGREPWDTPVTRIEVGGGYSIVRNVVAKAVFQRDWRDAPARNRLNLLSAQLLFWF